MSFSNTLMFYLATLIIIGYICTRGSSHGGGSALRRAFFVVVLLAPTWMTYQLRSIRLDFRVIVGVVGFLAVFIFPPKKHKLVIKPMLSDVFIFLMYAAIVISQAKAGGGLAPLTPADIAAEWLTTYMAGRVFLQHESEIDDMISVIFWTFLIVCGLNLFEAIVQKNMVNTILGKTFPLLEQGEGYRWGMKRAQGNVVHPIFNGFQLVMLFPWAAEAARRVKDRKMKKIYRLVTWTAGIAAFFSISSGPQIALLLTNGIIVFFRKPKLRIPLIVIAVSGVTALYLGKSMVVHMLEQMAGGVDEENVRIIMIDGEPTEYSGTKHRILLLRVYADALRDSGYFGWGKALRGIELPADIAQRFGSIDSHYLMFYLQYGYIGIGLFCALMLTVTYYAICAAWNAKGPWCTLAGGISGAFLAVGLLMSSVWFAPDYGAVWLFNAGLIANIRSLPKNQSASPSDGESTEEAVETESATKKSPRRLVPVTQR